METTMEIGASCDKERRRSIRWCWRPSGSGYI